MEDSPKSWDWRQAREVLDKALDLDSEERADFVERECADSAFRRHVMSMIHAFESGVGTEEETEAAPGPRTETLDGPASSNPDEGRYGPGSRVGAYRLERSIGAGGMGTVYLARRSDSSFDQRVAVKLLKRQWASADEVHRFRRERQILADLEHPSIAQLLDGGNTEHGHPYLVMEYVDGEPIDRYCRRHGADLEQRLELFRQVCAAVQYAHRNLIVHRDLKPSNILVDGEGRVKLLDFGIAKILNAAEFSMTVLETRPGSSPMTLAYASPEQVQGKGVTIATDVYSLGIVLYELLSDRRPYRFESHDLLAAVSAICNQDVTNPSHEIRRLPEDEPTAVPWRRVRGDLDAIVLKALAKDPEQRYESVEQLADDLRRFRDHQPVRARVDTLVYRGRKFLYRHRVGLSAAALVFLVLVGSILVLLRQQRLLIDQRNLARSQQLRAETVTDWMIELFELPDPGRALGRQVTARELLDKSAETVRDDLAQNPEVLGQMLSALGRTYANLGLYAEAEEMIDSALPLVDSGSVEALELMLLRVDLVMDQGRYLEAHERILETSARVAEGLPSEHSLRVRSLSLQGVIESRLGRYSEAEPLFRQAEDVARAVDDDESLAEVLEFYGEFVGAQNRFAFAETLLREAVELNRERLGPLHPEVTELESKLAFVVAEQNEPERGEALLRDVIERQRKVLGDSHSALAGSLDTLAVLLTDQKRYAEAEPLFREAVEMGVETLGAMHPLVGRFLSNYGFCRLGQGDLDEAEALYRRVISIVEVEQGRGSLAYGNTLNQLGSIAYRRGRFEEAERLYRSAFEVLEAAVGPSHGKTVMASSNVATAKTRQNDREGAREWYQTTVERARNAPEPLPELSQFLFNAALNDKALSRAGDAVEGFRRVAELDGTESRRGLEALTHLSHLLVEEEQWQEAAESAERAVEGWQALGGAEVWELSALRARGLALLGMGRKNEARALFEKRLERIRGIPSLDPVWLERAEEDLADAS